MSTMRMRGRPGFSMIQLVVVLVIFGGVVGIAVPAILNARRASALTTTLNNLSECAKAVHGAHDQHKSFPPYYGVYGGNPTPMTFHAHLLPFVGQSPLYNNPVPNAVVPLYLSPMDPTRTGGGAGATNYPVNLRLFYTHGGSGVGSLTPSDQPIYPRMPNTFQQDGTSNTLLFATKYQHCGDGGSMWMDPGNNALGSKWAATIGGGDASALRGMDGIQNAPTREACNPATGQAVSFNAGIIQYAMCDASVHSMKLDFPHAGSWMALLTPNGGDYFENRDGDWDK
jgi:type II secretory pathway pseudopilin PulG